MQPLSAKPDSISELFLAEYIIPDYQRPYRWDIDQCEKLWDDIKEFHYQRIDSEGIGDYFLGSITVYDGKDEDENDVMLVIDGQQRIITLSLLIKALYEKETTNEGLLACICKSNVNKRSIDTGSPKVVSRVIEKDDNKYFKDIITKNKPNGSTRLGKNYERIRKCVDEWFEENPNNPKAVDDLVTTLLKKVKVLRINADSEDDAFMIFETINDRGVPLDATDIFKVKLCKKYEENDPKRDRKDFFNEWKELEEHWFLFVMYMYILRARDNVTDSTMPKLRKYFEDKFDEPKTVMEDLAKIKDIRDANFNMPPKVMQWWKVIEKFPNVWWQYPLYVFLFNKMEKKLDDGRWDVSESVDDFDELIKSTIKYLVIKGVIYRSVSQIKTSILRVCADIANGKDNYLSKYDEDMKKEADAFTRSIEDHDNFGRYRELLVYLNSCLVENESGTDGEFYKKINQSNKKIHIEHILPKNWNNYDDWDETSHAENLNRLGNMMLLPSKTNIQASNEFFQKKKEKYKEVKFLKETDLVAETPDTNWNPALLNRRDKEIKDRIFNFLGYRDNQDK